MDHLVPAVDSNSDGSDTLSGKPSALNAKRPHKVGPFRRLERETRFELATSTLARLRSTS